MPKISKIEGAKRNLATAIRLFFEGKDAVAVHTLAAAAQGVIRDVARHRRVGVTSMLHDHPDIPAHARGMWLALLNEPRNFFKHADRDPDGELEFDESANQTLLLDAVLVLSELKEVLSEANVYIGWITTAHPELRGTVANNQIGEFAVRTGIKATDMKRFRELCDERILMERS